MRDEPLHLPLDGVVLPDARTGEPVDLAALPGVRVLSLIRHRFWLPCQEHLVQVQEQLAGAVPLVTIGFSPPDALGPLADHLGLTGPMLSDPHRVLYRVLDLRRASIRQVYSPGTVLHYARAVARGRRLQKPVEDTRQLGGDALVVEGVARRVWRPASPDDRVDPAVVAALARRSV